MHSGMVSGKSFDAFSINEHLLTKCVEAVKEGDTLARKTGQIQSFEIFRNGFRMNLVIGRIMVIPPSVCDSKEDFPVALLYGALVKQIRPEDLADLMSAKIGDSEFDEYSEADMDEIKDKLFKVPGTKSKFTSLVCFLPSWTTVREYIFFPFSKNDEALANALRHLVFAVYYDPRLSSAFNALTQDTDTVDHGMELDVTNVTPKLQYPAVSENPLKLYPDLQSADDAEASQLRPTGPDKKKKKASVSKPKMIFAAETQNEAVADMLAPEEVDVIDAVTDAAEAAVLQKRVSVEEAAKEHKAALVKAVATKRASKSKKAHADDDQGAYVNFVIDPQGHLNITATELGREELDLMKDKPTDAALAEIFDDLTSNGWSWGDPEELGALTSGPILVSPNGNVYWHERYQIEDPIDMLAKGETVRFDGMGPLEGEQEKVEASLDPEMTASAKSARKIAGQIPCPHCKHTEPDTEALEDHIARAHKNASVEKLAFVGRRPQTGGPVDQIEPGDSVTMYIPAGMGREGQEYKPATGRAVMPSGDGQGWVLNMGGQHGTPGIVNNENFIKVRKRRSASSKVAYDPGKQAYVYQAALLCEDCGDKVKQELQAAGEAPENPEDENTYDSDVYPKGPYPDGGGESDSPAHCDSCGVFLENPLTSDGYEYLREAIREHEEQGRGNDEWVAEMKAFYPEAFMWGPTTAPTASTDKTADTADNAANEKGGEGAIKVKTETEIKNTRGTEPELAPSKNASKTAKTASKKYPSYNNAHTGLSHDEFFAPGIRDVVGSWIGLESRHNAGAENAQSDHSKRARDEQEAKLKMLRHVSGLHVADESEDLFNEITTDVSRTENEVKVEDGDGRPDLSKGEAETLKGSTNPKAAAYEEDEFPSDFDFAGASKKPTAKSLLEAAKKKGLEPHEYVGLGNTICDKENCGNTMNHPIHHTAAAQGTCSTCNKPFKGLGSVCPECTTKGAKAAAGHKPGCQCGFCKNKGSFGKKEDEPEKEEKKDKKEAGKKASVEGLSAPIDQSPTKPAVVDPRELEKQSIPTGGSSPEAPAAPSSESHSEPVTESHSEPVAEEPKEESGTKSKLFSKEDLDKTAALWLGDDFYDEPITKAANMAMKCPQCGGQATKEKHEDLYVCGKCGWKQTTPEPKAAGIQKRANLQIIATLDDLLNAEVNPEASSPDFDLAEGLLTEALDGGTFEDGHSQPERKVADLELESDLLSDSQVIPNAKGKDESQFQLGGPTNTNEPPNINAVREQLETSHEMDKHETIGEKEKEVEAIAAKEQAELAAPIEGAVTETVEAPIGSGKIVINITAAGEPQPPTFFECGVCGAVHPVGAIADAMGFGDSYFPGSGTDCRNDEYRLDIDQVYKDFPDANVISLDEQIEAENNGDPDPVELAANAGEEYTIEAGHDSQVEPVTSGMSNGNFGGGPVGRAGMPNLEAGKDDKYEKELKAEERRGYPKGFKPEKKKEADALAEKQEEVFTEPLEEAGQAITQLAPLALAASKKAAIEQGPQAEKDHAKEEEVIKSVENLDTGEKGAVSSELHGDAKSANVEAHDALVHGTNKAAESLEERDKFNAPCKGCNTRVKHPADAYCSSCKNLGKDKKAASGVCIRCGARLDIPENQPNEAEKVNKAFADRYCKRCLSKRPTAEPIVEKTSAKVNPELDVLELLWDYLSPAAGHRGMVQTGSGPKTKEGLLATARVAVKNNAVIETFWDYLRSDEEHDDRKQTGWGTKTQQGLEASLKRAVGAGKEAPMDMTKDMEDIVKRNPPKRGLPALGDIKLPHESSEDAPNDPPGYAKRVRELEEEGLTTSDAQAAADAEFAKKKTAGFMQHEIIGPQEWWMVDGPAGTSYFPADYFNQEQAVENYEGRETWEVEKVTGYGARLSAPGYLDSTEWSVFDTAEEAQAYLDEYYPEEDEEDEVTF